MYRRHNGLAGLAKRPGDAVSAKRHTVVVNRNRHSARLPNFRPDFGTSESECRFGSNLRVDGFVYPAGIDTIDKIEILFLSKALN